MKALISFCKIIVTIAIMCVFTINISYADSIAPNVPYKISSKNGKFVIEMTPASPYGEEGYGIARETGINRMLWRVNWFAASVILLDNGFDLIRFGPWASDYEGLTDLAVGFYRNGIGLKHYKVKDLIQDKSKITRTVSHYFWGAKGDGFYSLSTDERSFTINLIDKSRYTFDTTTGRIVEPSSADRRYGTVSSDMARSAETGNYETRKATAAGIRNEAYSLQRQNHLAEAILKYRQSYYHLPDRTLEQYIEKLEKIAGVNINNRNESLAALMQQDTGREQGSSTGLLEAVVRNRSGSSVYIYTEDNKENEKRPFLPGEIRNMTVSMQPDGKITFYVARDGRVLSSRTWQGYPESSRIIPCVIYDDSEAEKLVILTGCR